MRRQMLDLLACPEDRHAPLELHACSESGGEVEEGALYCGKCSRFYPIVEGIPVMLPDSLRDTQLDSDFLARNRGALPDKIRARGD